MPEITLQIDAPSPPTTVVLLSTITCLLYEGKLPGLES